MPKIILLIACCYLSFQLQTPESYIGIFTETKTERVNCICDYGGLLELKSGEEIPVCLDKLEDKTEKIQNGEEIMIKGNMKIKDISYHPDDPCQGGSVTLFDVTEAIKL